MHTDSDGREHHDGVPYCVATEQTQGLTLLVTILLGQGGRDVHGGISDLCPVQTLFSVRVFVAGMGINGIVVEGRPGRDRGIEQPVPYCEVLRHCSNIS